MSELPEGHESMGDYPTEEAAREGAHELLRMLNGLPPGWALYLAGDDQSGFKVVRYQP